MERFFGKTVVLDQVSAAKVHHGGNYWDLLEGPNKFKGADVTQKVVHAEWIGGIGEVAYLVDGQQVTDVEPLSYAAKVLLDDENRIKDIEFYTWCSGGCFTAPSVDEGVEVPEVLWEDFYEKLEGILDQAAVDALNA